MRPQWRLDGPMLGNFGARQRLVDDNYVSTTKLIPERVPLPRR
jgi:hypothetical protein